MRILFIYPDIITPVINFCPAIHILSAVIKRMGHEVDMLHINKEGVPYDKETVLNASKGYDLFAITSTSFNYRYANEIAGWLKEGYPDTLRILGGSHATIQPEDFEDSNFDIFCVGEGEEPMQDLIAAIETGRDWNEIPNLITRKRVNPVRGFLRNLDKLPFWDFDITNTEKILEQRNGWLSISFSRGCSYSCTFCINHLYKKIEMGPNDKMSDYLRRRTAENAVNELESLVNKYNIKFFNIDDDLLTTNRKWMREFTDLYRERIYKPKGIKYVINTRAALVTEELAHMLYLSGCKEARIGFETGNEELRNGLLLKKTSDKDLIKAFNILNNNGVMGVAFAMIGIPGESWDTFYETVDMIIRLRAKLIRMTFLFPYKHTRIYDICVERNLFKDIEITDNRDLGSCLKFEKLTDDELFCMRFMFAWYINFRWFHDMNYFRAICEFERMDFSDPEKSLSAIIEKDNELSSLCDRDHYKFYNDNNYYFQLYEKST